jgi:hypothetical protein
MGATAAARRLGLKKSSRVREPDCSLVGKKGRDALDGAALDLSEGSIRPVNSV